MGSTHAKRRSHLRRLHRSTNHQPLAHVTARRCLLYYIVSALLLAQVAKAETAFPALPMTTSTPTPVSVTVMQQSDATSNFSVPTLLAAEASPSLPEHEDSSLLRNVALLGNDNFDTRDAAEEAIIASLLESPERLALVASLKAIRKNSTSAPVSSDPEILRRLDSIIEQTVIDWLEVARTILRARLKCVDTVVTEFVSLDLTLLGVMSDPSMQTLWQEIDQRYRSVEAELTKDPVKPDPFREIVRALLEGYQSSSRLFERNLLLSNYVPLAPPHVAYFDSFPSSAFVLPVLTPSDTPLEVFLHGRTRTPLGLLSVAEGKDCRIAPERFVSTLQAALYGPGVKNLPPYTSNVLMVTGWYEPDKQSYRLVLELHPMYPVTILSAASETQKRILDYLRRNFVVPATEINPMYTMDFQTRLSQMVEGEWKEWQRSSTEAIAPSQ